MTIMTNKTYRPAGKKLTGYWIVTILLTLGMFSGGIAQVIQADANAAGMIRLGYPLYFMSILGVWKIFGVIVLLLPGSPLLKEWAYAGFFFVMTGAVLSHIISGDEIKHAIAPFILTILTVLSWNWRPANRRIVLKF